MTDKGYCNEARGEQIAAYLYDDLEAAERAAVESHLTACDSCRAEMASLRAVRRDLGRWALPEPSAGFTAGVAPAPGRLNAWARLTAMPAWAQVAAAMLVLGAAAGMANLDVRYDEAGLVVRTGWSRPLPAPSALPAAAGGAASAPWRSDLDRLARDLRGELEAHGADVRPAAADAEMRARVQTMIAESERRQERELALGLAELARDAQAQRRGDLEKIQYSLGILESNVGTMQNIGAEVMRQRQIINGLAVPASQSR